MYYLSRVLQGPEVRYTVIEKMCLYLSFAATKLRHCLLPRQTFVIAKDFIKYMQTRPFLKGRIGKWILALSEFTFTYLPQQSVKGQVLADFLVDHPLDLGKRLIDQDEEQVLLADIMPWRFYFDGSSIKGSAGAHPRPSFHQQGQSHTLHIGSTSLAPTT